MEQPIFRAVELLDMAVEIELRGLEFYEACLARAEHPQVKQALQFMAKEEARHGEIFTRMKEGQVLYELPESYPGEMRAYLAGFVSDKVFPSAEDHPKAMSLDDTDRVIETAIEFEKRSILFYSAMKQVIRPSEGKIVEQVITEEHSHIRRLLALRKDLEGSGSTADEGRG
ncbi:MAG: ferritin family protein [Desulfomonilaceae bacterium]|nr:ferritin family protein [Desulfomonilaceae bacterium]